MKGIGLFGGTFNPIHNGHLNIAQEVLLGFQMEKIYFIPSSIPPHKKTENLADAGHRYQMIASAISPFDRFDISDVEIHRSGRSYSIDTIQFFIDALPGSQFFLMLGIDAFLEFNTWKSFRNFFDMIPIIVIARPMHPPVTNVGAVDELKAYIHAHIDSRYQFLTHPSCFIHPKKYPIYYFCVPPMAISSSQIRNAVQQGHSIQSLVPETVRKYIYAKGLYL